jgi:hypothetical protein
MACSTPGPSTRLLSAAAAERHELARQRGRLLAARDPLRDELARIDASLQEIDERTRLLDRGPAGAPRAPAALHYRDWYEAVSAAGFNVAGKDPLAVFLTQISRSPVIRKSTQSGVYELDTTAARRLRGRLERLHEDLRSLAATAGAAPDLAVVRSRRAQIHSEISHVEKSLMEAEELLGTSNPPPLEHRSTDKSDTRGISRVPVALLPKSPA